RFEREAATWRRLKHRHILEFLGTFQRDGHFYLVSPFMENGTLLEYLGRNPDIDRVRLLGQTADAINYLHIKDVLHGDIKASNILISREASVLLCDFGLARMTDSDTSSLMKGAGSTRWMAPELFNKEPKSTETDIHAFGMTIAEVLKGEVPLKHLSSQGAIMLAVMTGERPSEYPRSSSAGIPYDTAWGVAKACWEPDPSERISIREACRLLLIGGSRPAHSSPFHIR
ncbi:hypothetical protein M407DRAFT_67620, partial [Tulasnella calospora MUT 4182]